MDYLPLVLIFGLVTIFLTIYHDLFTVGNYSIQYLIIHLLKQQTKFNINITLFHIFQITSLIFKLYITIVVMLKLTTIYNSSYIRNYVYDLKQFGSPSKTFSFDVTVPIVVVNPSELLASMASFQNLFNSFILSIYLFSFTNSVSHFSSISFRLCFGRGYLSTLSS